MLDEPTDNPFQVIRLTGRLTADVHPRPDGGTQAASLRLAIHRPRNDGADQGADHVDIARFGRQAHTCAQYLTTGRKVAIEGHLHHSESDSDSGHRLEVVARNVEFLDAAKGDETDSEPAEATETAPPAA